MKTNKYEILKRFDELRQGLPLYLQDFCTRYEITRATFFRDLKVLNELYNIHYEYEPDLKAYIVK